MPMNTMMYTHKQNDSGPVLGIRGGPGNSGPEKSGTRKISGPMILNDHPLILFSGPEKAESEILVGPRWIGNGWAWRNPMESEKSGVRKSGFRKISRPRMRQKMGGPITTTYANL